MENGQRGVIFIGKLQIKRTIFSRKDVQIIEKVEKYILDNYSNYNYSNYIKKVLKKYIVGYIYEKDEQIIGLCVWKYKEKKYHIYTNKSDALYKHLQVLLIHTEPAYNKLQTIILHNIENFAERYKLKMIIVYLINNNMLKLFEDNDYYIDEWLSRPYISVVNKTMDYDDPYKPKNILFDKRDHEIIDKSMTYILNLFKNYISNKYIETSFNKLSNGYIYTLNNVTTGCCIWKIKKINPDNEINSYEYSCTYLRILLIGVLYYRNNFRRKILNDIYYYSKMNNIKYILLEPETDRLVKFYERNGYSIVANLPTKLMAKYIQ
jgi:hypothetical protein